MKPVKSRLGFFKRRFGGNVYYHNVLKGRREPLVPASVSCALWRQPSIVADKIGSFRQDSIVRIAEESGIIGDGRLL